MTTPVTTRRGVGRPRDAALQDRRREEILDQAATVFAEHGLAGTDVQWIADALRLSKGTIYHYFPSKRELFLAAVRRGVEQLRQHVDQCMRNTADPIDRIAAAVEQYLAFFAARRSLVELFLQERAEFKENHTPVYFEKRDQRKGPWRDLVAELIAAGRIRPMPVERVLNVLGDVLYGTMFTNHLSGRNQPFQEQAADIVDVIFNGVVTDGERLRRCRGVDVP